MPENPESEGSRLITLKQIELEHGVSRSALHTYRRSASFPQPVPVEGSTKIQYRADEVAAWFHANPKQQGKKRDEFVSHQQGEPMDARANLYAFAMRGKEQSPDNSEEATARINDFRAAALAEAVGALKATARELSELAEKEMRRDLEERAQEWHDAADTVARLALKPPTGQ